ncbi:MAG: DUF3025 domain-containing protein [Xanthomonadales bacterium]|nr:DUF3025 domain-containing protein [Xanthomonadales bacterium]
MDISRPYWADYRGLLQHLRQAAPATGELPGPQQVQSLLPPHAVNQRGLPIRFRPSALLPGAAYEQHIFQTGEVSTRSNNWHDLFNALVWCRFTRLKSAMNAAHFVQLGSRHKPDRGPQRDALTLFDESGVIVASTRRGFLNALAAREWNEVFVQQKSVWNEEVLVFVCGHALLEKFLTPYKALTAHALLLHINDGLASLPREEVLQNVDRSLAQPLLESRIVASTASLSPLPLMGIPGWWPQSGQDADFYADRRVFRPSAATQGTAAVLEFADYQARP